MTPDPPSSKAAGTLGSEDGKYSLVMHGLCKKYGVRSAVEKLVFSTIENMSRRGRPCLLKLETLAEYAGGNPADVEVALARLQDRGCIEPTSLGNTPGWRLTAEARRAATYFKDKIRPALKR